MALGNARSAIAIVTIGSLTVFAHRDAAHRRAAFPPDEDLLYLPRADALRASALGHTELAADLVFLRSVIRFASALVTTRRYEWLNHHVDTVIELDPEFRAPYLFGSRATMYNGLPITNEMVASSSHFLEEGLARFPNDWELGFALGCNYLFELKSNDPKQRDAWRRTGGRWIRRAALSGGGPPWLASLAARIMSEEGQVEASIRYLEEVYLTAQDENAKREIALLLAAKRQSNVAQLAIAGEAFNAKWQRELPYAPADFYVLLGDSPSSRLDLPALTVDPVLEADERETREADDRARR